METRSIPLDDHHSSAVNHDYDEFNDGDIRQHTDAQHDDDGFGDDFDDFEEGAEAEDDDFGDFDDGFQQPQEPTQSPPLPSPPSVPDSLAHLVSSLNRLHTIPESTPLCLPTCISPISTLNLSTHPKTY